VHVARVLVVGVCAALVAGACGSTVQQTGGATLAGDALDGGATGGIPSGGGGGDELGAPPAGSSTGGGSARVAGGTAGQRGSGPATPSGPSDLRPGPGVTATEIVIGVEYIGDDALNQAAQIQGTNPGDIGAYWRAVVDDINGRGGILGRKVKALHRPFSSANQASPEDQQAACSFFTEDNEVFAVMTRNGSDDTYKACLHRRGVVAIGTGGLTPFDAETYRRFPWFVTGGSLTLDRIAKTTADRLWAQGFFAPSSRLGLVTFDDPAFERAVERSYIPALAAHGVRFAQDARIQRPDSEGDYPGLSTAVSSAVLRFKSEGIDRVVFLQLGGDLALFFMTAAESQGYHPRYGMNSQDAGQVLASNVPAAQLHGAIGIGWVPGTDVPAQHDPPRWPARQRCFDLITGRGVAFPTRYGETIADTVCDQMSVLAASLTAGGAPNKERFIAGLDSLGPFALAATFAGNFGPNAHDGAGAVRDVAFEDGCRCFRYTSGDHLV
jgi:ABC-type branched-subunit amino acid transport system substrate-binding protein